ncbi:STE family protein kinase [Metarhizium rileyi]|uniref:non-specific serine/threonine protein kinase n=1 Tax=Metarhizium rileyi (strain RCEF 4871) TaxID=1649241 RepID=A0A167CP32_METRR|nr:STE family protein kinase [Metarhizium rileyi RCEF 4871]TWU74160.1 hypothetical protein ED733_005873 [Metarhizium rileyi]
MAQSDYVRAVPNPVYPEAIFSLVLLDDGNERTVGGQLNERLKWRTGDGSFAIAIGSNRQIEYADNLAVLGRGRDANVMISNPFVCSKHCSFALHPTTHAVVLYNHAQDRTTFHRRRGSFAVVPTDGLSLPYQVNAEIRLGNPGSYCVRFRLLWHRDPTKIKEGEGTKDASKNLATVVRRKLYPKQYNYQALWQEIRQTRHLKHDNLVEIIAWTMKKEETENVIEWTIDSKHGSLFSLIESQDDASGTANHGIARLAMGHILQALDYLSFKGIAHGGVRPENILYTRLDSQPEFHFQLGDFGHCIEHQTSRSNVGTDPFIAPEIDAENPLKTCKADIWSLFVTTIWTLDVKNYRTNPARQTKNSILDASQSQVMHNLRTMASINPDERPSAAQLLVRCFEGEGLSTAKEKIQHIDDPISATEFPFSMRKAPTVISTKQTAAEPLSDKEQGGRSNTWLLEIKGQRLLVCKFDAVPWLWLPLLLLTTVCEPWLRFVAPEPSMAALDLDKLE